MKMSPIISLPEARNLLRKEQELYVIYDGQVAWALPQVMESLPVRGSFGMQTSEERKTMATVLELERKLLEAGASRRALLLAIGGGITTDIVGFTAAIYKRGIRYANIPTTLLAQVDAAIGGKTGVNLDGYKNMLGAFRMPEFTVLEARFLRTLPPREFRTGLAEMLKTFLIGDGPAYAFAVSSLKNASNEDEEGKMGLSSLERAHFEDDIRRAAAIKAQIVENDPFEQGERAKLNLGHTFGHAIEHEAREAGMDITHGEAVAIGIIMAARVSEALGLAEKGLAQALKTDFERIGLPTESPFAVEKLAAAMEKDKKAGGGKVTFVLPVRVGEVVLKPLTVADAIAPLEI